MASRTCKLRWKGSIILLSWYAPHFEAGTLKSKFKSYFTKLERKSTHFTCKLCSPQPEVIISHAQVAHRCSFPLANVDDGPQPSEYGSRFLLFYLELANYIRKKIKNGIDQTKPTSITGYFLITTSWSVLNLLLPFILFFLFLLSEGSQSFRLD